MKALYFVTTGINDPTTASIPLHLAANGSLEVGHDVEVVLAGHATDVLLGDNVETTQGIGVPPMRELFDKLKNHGVPVYV
jgi:predicted peroxiredoxin